MFGWLKDRIQTDSLVIVGVFVLWVILIVFLSHGLKISFFFSFMGAAAIAWAAMHFYEKKFLGDSLEDSPVIYCEWENRLNLTDFRVSEMTKLDLNAAGLSLKSAIGSEFVFHTEPSLEHPDFYFEGTIVEDKDGNFLIRSSNKVPIKLAAVDP